MVRNQAALGEEMAGAALPMEPLQNQVQEPEKLGSPEQQVAGEQRPEPPEKPVGDPQGPKEPAAVASLARTRDPSGEKTLSLRPTFLRVPQPSLGYGSFRCRGSASSEQLQGRGDREGALALVPVSAPAEAQPREGETSTVGAAREPGEVGSGAWAPVELQVDVRVKPVGAAVSGLSPSPVPATRFFSVSVPDSPAFSRHSSFSRSGVPRTPSPGSTWGGSPHPLAGWADRYREQEGRASPGPVRSGESPSGLPRCRCRELGLEDKEWEKLLPGCGADGDQLHQVIARIGLPTYMKSLRWALAVLAVLLAVAVITIVALASRVGFSQCPSWLYCPCVHRNKVPTLSRRLDMVRRTLLLSFVGGSKLGRQQSFLLSPTSVSPSIEPNTGLPEQISDPEIILGGSTSRP
ncbi:killer cell lectin-like receptor subfamily G member 2 isoform X2 [Antechinus flavipes]|uniref:killer cell lectin-like receptor subfamily G member 2 isoform X2 n=1 Tax=Antechinus flavipes TaxID=38775 RepID=UPI002236A04C|nr:killer cell lectin-like receptor subfamily G member 2 isoform X2 [Antechinus flavipes]